jgi:chemotaxis signal transduction protein
VLVVTAGGHTVGLEVDEVSEVFSVDPAQLQTPPQQLADTSVVSGILRLEGRLVIIVDIDALVGTAHLASVV